MKLGNEGGKRGVGGIGGAAEAASRSPQRRPSTAGSRQRADLPASCLPKLQAGLRDPRSQTEPLSTAPDIPLVDQRAFASALLGGVGGPSAAHSHHFQELWKAEWFASLSYLGSVNKLGKKR